jgi:hypothetical protein
MATGAVVVYFSRLGGRLRCDQKIMLDANAQLIAKLHFAGEDPQLGPLLRYTVVKRKKSHRG